MQKNKKVLTGIVLVLIVFVMVVTVYLISDRNANTVYGKKFVTANGENYIEFSSKDAFTKYTTKADGTETEDSGKYSVDGDKITLDESKMETVYKDNYILVKDELLDLNYYTMYYDSKKSEEFVNSLSDILPTYIRDSVETEDGLKDVLTETEVDRINYCFKTGLDEDQFSCSVDYRVYLKDYDYTKGDEYDELFAGSSPIYEKEYVLRWSFFSFKPEDNGYVIVGAGTGV